MSQRVGPKVSVEINYTCNGCQYHKVETDEGDANKNRYHACHHPSVLEEYNVSQRFGRCDPELSIHHTARTNRYICPYIKEEL